MKNSFIIINLLLLIIACQSQENKFTGTWKIETWKMSSLTSGFELNDDGEITFFNDNNTLGALLGLTDSTNRAIMLVINKNGKFEIAADNNIILNGHWKSDGDSVLTIINKDSLTFNVKKYSKNKIKLFSHRYNQYNEVTIGISKSNR